METDPTLITPDGSLDVGSQLPDVDSMMSNILGPFFWVSIILTILMIVLYVYSSMRRRKVERAILDIQKMLHEMNERDKARTQPQQTKNILKDDKIIASEGPNQDNLG